jgi:hypothetical protein
MGIFFTVNGDEIRDIELLRVDLHDRPTLLL